MKILKELTDIPEKVYEGYVWYSDQPKPRVLNNEQFCFSGNAINPFVVEAMLFCNADKTSIMVKHTGRYVITQFDLNALPEGAELESKNYLPHRLGEGIEKVSFQQIWIPETDELCNDMPVLKLKAIAFTGFNKPTNN